jgi:hypothetical protein
MEECVDRGPRANLWQSFLTFSVVACHPVAGQLSDTEVRPVLGSEEAPSTRHPGGARKACIHATVRFGGNRGGAPLMMTATHTGTSARLSRHAKC